MQAILNAYVYGSSVYGTSDKNSDIDFIVVVDDQPEKEIQYGSQSCNVNSYSKETFQNMLDAHEIVALECYFLPDVYKVENYLFSFNLDLELLRRSLSEKSSNSWVKAKKKIDLHQEYYVGIKSLFHCLRILDFGLQISKYGRIVDYTRANYCWQKIKEQNYTCWADYKKYWQEKYNNLKSEFRVVAPL